MAKANWPRQQTVERILAFLTGAATFAAVLIGCGTYVLEPILNVHIAWGAAVYTCFMAAFTFWAALAVYNMFAGWLAEFPKPPKDADAFPSQNGGGNSGVSPAKPSKPETWHYFERGK